MSHFRPILAAASVAAALLLTHLPERAEASGVYVALQPATATVTPGSLFELDVVVTDAGDPFNAYEAVIGFDPAALTFVAMAPLSQQEGSLMTGACPNRSNIFHSAPDSLRISHSLLCNGVDVTGPGTVYRLQFRASNTQQVTHVTFRRHAGPPTGQGLQFYEAGIAVSGVTSTDAAVGIGVPVGVGREPPAARLSLRAWPSPARGAVQLSLTGISGAGPLRVQVLDLDGRLVRTLAGPSPGSGEASLRWDGRDEAGRRAPVGHYFVLARTGKQSAGARLVLAR